MAESNEQRIEQTDLDTIKKLREEYLTTTATVGQVEVEINVLSKRLDELKEYKTSLLDKYNELQQTEKTLVDTMQEKYGEGIMDIESGKFYTDSENTK